MVDRCNIVVSEKSTLGKSLAEVLANGSVVLYSHWGGSEMPEDLRRALAKRWRWDDPQYLTRIIFDEFCPERGKETGHGISTYIGDNEHPIMVVDVARKLVLQFPSDTPGCRATHGWTFNAYASQRVADYSKQRQTIEEIDKLTDVVPA